MILPPLQSDDAYGGRAAELLPLIAREVGADAARLREGLTRLWRRQLGPLAI